MYKNIYFTLAVLFLSTNLVMAQDTQYDEVSYEQNVKEIVSLKESVLTVPAGQVFVAISTTPLSSENVTLGQDINFVLPRDFYYNGSLVAPAGSSVNGSVLEVSKAKHGTVNGKLTLRFNQIITPYGVKIPISALVHTDNDKGVMIGGANANTVNTRMREDASANARSVNNSNYSNIATIGTSVGYGGGVIKSIWDKGIDVVIPANSGVELILTQPITVNPSVNQNDF